MKKISIFIAFTLVLLLSPKPSFCLSYYGYDTYGGTWHDVNKDWNTDTGLCWSIAASNILAYTGWGFPTGESFGSAQDIQNYYKSHFGNTVGNTDHAVAWWFDGLDHSFWNDPLIPGGGFYLDHNLGEFSTKRYARTASQYFSLFDEGYGAFQLSIRNDRLGGHAVTLWGYEYDENGNYIGVYITDSDDRYYGLKYFDIYELGGLVYLDDYKYWGGGVYYDFYISNAFALDFMPETAIPTPEPSTMLLLGTGLGGLALYRRKAKK